MNFPHDIIRDAWAVRHGGRTEVPVGQDRLGVELQVVRFDSNTFTLSSQTAAVDWLRQANYRTVYGGSR